MSEIVEKIQRASVEQLNNMLIGAFAALEQNHPSAYMNLQAHTDTLLDAFSQQMDGHFDELLDKPSEQEDAVVNFETLSLVQEDELEVMVALEGMVNASRNDHLPNFISFNTRLNSLFAKKRIDETTNPLDPDQIASAFQEALRPINLEAQATLTIYRTFNEQVLKRLDELLRAANQVLIDNGVIPDLGMETPEQKQEKARTSRTKKKDTFAGFGTVEEEEFEDDQDRPELFSMMQNLMHPGAETAPGGSPGGTTPAGTAAGGVAPAGGADVLPAGHVAVPIEQAQALQSGQYMIPAAMLGAQEGTAGGGSGVMQPFQPSEGQQVQMVDQAKLMEILSNIQGQLETKLPEGDQVPTNLAEVERLDISQSLGEMLIENESEGVVNAVDRQSSDIINLVTLLYEAIWEDSSVPIPIKELIGRTQITIIKVALSDTSFFDRENHPARAILNEFAAAGIGWTEVDALAEDPLYKQIQDLVTRIQTEYSGDISFFEGLIKEFRQFRAQHAARTRQLEQSILKANERKERLEDIHELVSQKIEDRLLGRELDPFVKELLEVHFHKFMVMLVLKEGPGGNAWKQAVNTIDVLLWTVQPHEDQGDRERLGTINPRLLNNLRKAMRIASLEMADIDTLIVRLQDVQQASFQNPADSTEPATPPTSARDAAPAERPSSQPEAVATTEAADTDTDEAISAAPEEDNLDDFLAQVDSLTVGVWVEFAGQDELNTRCKLAAKINAIDKLIFVNRQGVKVVEKTKVGLAREIKDGTVNIISDGLLFSRALESVIGNLRESQHEQQTGSAYQPDAREDASS